jgi:diadenosine tetraphosphatase ApaH/serine/threonine PP2A family protein phosphatase
VYGFYEELIGRFEKDDAEKLWRAFNDLFAYFPLAAIVHGKILCMHGGISSALKSLDDIRNVSFLYT